MAKGQKPVWSFFSHCLLAEILRIEAFCVIKELFVFHDVTARDLNQSSFWYSYVCSLDCVVIGTFSLKESNISGR